MSVLQYVGFLLGASFASGLNLYASVAALGLLDRSGAIHLPTSLKILAQPLLLGIAIALYAIEFFADKVPYLDNVWDVIHTFIRPPAAAILAYWVMSGAPAEWRVAAAMFAGGVALVSHGTKASARLAVNTTQQGRSNSLVSLGEDGMAVGLVWMAATHPLLTTAVAATFVAFSLYILANLSGLLRHALGRLFRSEPVWTFPTNRAGAP